MEVIEDRNWARLDRASTLESSLSFLLDPHLSMERVRSKIHTELLRYLYPFHTLGRRVSIHYSSEIRREFAKSISIEDGVYIAPEVWLNVSGDISHQKPSIILKAGCKIGRRTMLSASTRICVEEQVLFSPGVLVMDHIHRYSDPSLPIHEQGVTQGASVTIGRNSWVGFGAVICSSSGDLQIGRNSVIGANAVVTKSFPSYSVIVGNPARLVKMFDPIAKEWVRVDGEARA